MNIELYAYKKIQKLKFDIFYIINTKVNKKKYCLKLIAVYNQKARVNIKYTNNY